MTDREQLEREARAQLRALRATPGAFEQWVKLLAGATIWQARVEQGDQDAYETMKRRLGYADAYAAQVREEFEADLMGRAYDVLQAVGVDDRAVEDALFEAGGMASALANAAEEGGGDAD